MTIDHTKDFLKRLPWGEVLQHALAAAFFIYAFMLCLRPLSDPDLWWHLKTGQWIVQNRELPAAGGEDPFAFTLPRPLPEGNVKGMQTQWLGQVLLYSAFSLGGYEGFSAFRAMVIVLPFIYFYARFSTAGGLPLLALLAVSFPPLFISKNLFYTFERPQVFSFYLTLVVFLLLRQLRRQEGRALFVLLPAVMALWSNLHGAYVVGVVLIGIFAVGEAFTMAARRFRIAMIFEAPPVAPVRFFGSCVLGVAAAGLNPNGYRFLYGWLRGFLAPLMPGAGGASSGLVLSEVLEYKSLWFFYEAFHYTWPLYLGAFFIFCIVAMGLRYLLRRRIDISEALAGVFVFVFGVYYAKGMNFAILLLPFFVGVFLASMKSAGRRALIAVPAALLVLVMVADFVRTTPRELRPRVPDYWIHPSYPEGAVQFLIEHEVKGEMFNEMRWGGYLMWRLYPRYLVFADGRLVNDKVNSMFFSVMKGKPGWDELLKLYNVNFAVIPVMSLENGVISPLAIAMGKTESWRLVYLWNNCAVFIRDEERNREVIDCCGLPKAALYREVGELADFLLSMNPSHPEAMLSKAISLYELGRYEEAKAMLKRVPMTGGILEELLKKLEGY